MTPIPPPHCDPRVLHRPQACRLCAQAKYGPLRRARQALQVLFTGELPRAGWLPCPAEAERGLDVLNEWPGNEPMDLIYDRRRAEDLAVLKASIDQVIREQTGGSDGD